MQSNFDAIIIGAGPAGASAAILLASAGWYVVLVEKQNFPRRKVCGECIAASNLPLLDALGIGSEFKAQAGPELRQVAMMRGARTVNAELPAADHPKHAWGRALGRETLDTLLLARARDVGVVVLQPCSVQNIGGAIGKHECTVRMAGSQRQMILKAPVAILAHGSWEPLPAARAEAGGERGVVVHVAVVVEAHEAALHRRPEDEQGEHDEPADEGRHRAWTAEVFGQQGRCGGRAERHGPCPPSRPPATHGSPPGLAAGAGVILASGLLAEELAAWCGRRRGGIR